MSLALIMAEGYNYELLKSERQMLDEVQQAIGEALPYRPSSRREAQQTARSSGATVG